MPPWWLTLTKRALSLCWPGYGNREDNHAEDIV